MRLYQALSGFDMLRICLLIHLPYGVDHNDDWDRGEHCEKCDSNVHGLTPSAAETPSPGSSMSFHGRVSHRT